MGHDGGGFLGEIEYSLISNKEDAKETFQNPFFIAIFSGQFLLLFSLLNINYRRFLAICGIILLGIVVVFLLIMGLFVFYVSVIASIIPFIFLSMLYILKKYDDNEDIIK